MPTNIAFRDRLPTDFGSENLRERVRLFDDFLVPDPTANSWERNNVTGTSVSNQGTMDYPGGLYNFGAIGSTVGSGSHLTSAVTFSYSEIALGCRVVFDNDAAGGAGADWNSTGFFLGLAGGSPTFALLGAADGDWASDTAIGVGDEVFGILRDKTTIDSDGRPSFQLVHIKRSAKGYDNYRVDIQLPTNLESKRFYTFGLAIAENGLAKATIDEEVVATFRPNFLNDSAEILVSSFNSYGTSNPEALLLDWIYASHPRGILY